MNKDVYILSANNAFWTTLLFNAVALAFLAPKTAVNMDKHLHYPHAKRNIMSCCLYIHYMQNLIYVIFPVSSSIKRNELKKV